MLSAEIPLADHAPSTYRKLNPKKLKDLTKQLIQLVGSEEEPRDAKLLVAEYTVEQVGLIKDSIHGIAPEDFAARILSKTGIVTLPGEMQSTWSDQWLPIVAFEGVKYVIDFGAKNAFGPLNEWPGW